MPLATIKQLLQQARGRIDLLDAELIIAFVLKKNREFVVAHGEREIVRLKDCKIKRLLKKRAEGVPLAYLVGHKEFFGLDFVVNKSVLVPRPETEVLVESALSECRMQIEGGKKIALIDVGTGSGCIPITIVKTMKQFNNGTIKTFATDISKSALRIAKLNAKKHGVKIKFLHGNLLTPLVNNLTIQQFNNSTIIITANLPYLTPKQYKNSLSIQHEPKSALVAGKTGLELFEELFKQIKQIKNYPPAMPGKAWRAGKLKIINLLEIDPSQSKPIVKLIKKYFPNAKVKIKKDLSGRDRVVTIMC